MENDEPDYDPKEKEKPPIWMVSFADVTALTLTFFVLLFSMSTFKINEFIAVTSAISVSQKTDPNINPLPTSERAIDKTHEIRGLPLDYVYQLLKSKINDLNLQNSIFIAQKDIGIVLTLSDKVLFDAGSFVLSRDARRLLFELTPVISSIGNQVDIIGHVAPAPDDVAENKTTWDTSLLRSLTVSQQLIDDGYDRQLSVLASADGFFQDVDSSLPLEQRKILAQRVDILIRENASGQ